MRHAPSANGRALGRGPADSTPWDRRAGMRWIAGCHDWTTFASIRNRFSERILPSHGNRLGQTQPAFVQRPADDAAGHAQLGQLSHVGGAWSRRPRQPRGTSTARRISSIAVEIRARPACRRWRCRCRRWPRSARRPGRGPVASPTPRWSSASRRWPRGRCGRRCPRPAGRETAGKRRETNRAP